MRKCWIPAEVPIDTFDTEVIPWAHSADASKIVAEKIAKHLKLVEDAAKHAANCTRTRHAKEEERKKSNCFNTT